MIWKRVEARETSRVKVREILGLLAPMNKIQKPQSDGIILIPVEVLYSYLSQLLCR